VPEQQTDASTTGMFIHGPWKYKTDYSKITINCATVNATFIGQMWNYKITARKLPGTVQVDRISEYSLRRHEPQRSASRS
jgi:hypothetical protein